MAGGKYDKLAGKTRPGTYINFESERNDVVGNSERGIVLLPLIGYDFWPYQDAHHPDGSSPGCLQCGARPQRVRHDREAHAAYS